MRSYVYSFLVLVLMAGCTPLATVMPLATAGAELRPASAMITTPIPTFDELATARSVLANAEATARAQEIAITERAAADARATAAFWDAVTVAAITEQARGTQTMQSVQYTETARAHETQAAQTATSGASTGTAIAFWEGATTTALVATQKVNNAKENAAKAGAWIWRVGIPLLFLIALGASLFIYLRAYERNQKAEAWQRSTIRQGAHEKVFFPSDAIKNGVTDPSLMATAHYRPGDVAALTPDQVWQLKQLQTWLDAIKAATLPGARPATKMLTNSQAPTPEPISPDVELMLNRLPLPGWAALDGWDHTSFPLGMNERGLMTVNPDNNPHFLFAGTTGSGKSRRGVRTLISAALAMNFQVIIVGKGIDYQPFADHPNAYVQSFSLMTEPERAIGLLRAAYSEIERRERILESTGASLWSHTGGVRTMVVIDEFSNLADALEDISKAKKDDLFRWARMASAEARKYGMHMVFALQDPTYSSIDLRIRRNTTPVAFRVKDQAVSRAVLNESGAETLQEGHFLTVLSHLVHGLAFMPSDDEVSVFLRQNQARVMEEPKWIEGEVRDVSEQGQARDDAETVIDWQIWTLYLEQKEAGRINLAEIQRLVFEDANTGGANFNRIKRVIERFESSTGATTTGPGPAFGPSGA